MQLSNTAGIKIVVAGNHGLFLDANFPGRRIKTGQTPSSPNNSAGDKTVDWGDIIYLQDTETTITCANGRRLRIYGSPCSPEHDNWAFQYPRSKDIWGGKVPDDTDILITHGPPRAHLDLLSLGCVYLPRRALARSTTVACLRACPRRRGNWVVTVRCFAGYVWTSCCFWRWILESYLVGVGLFKGVFLLRSCWG